MKKKPTLLVALLISGVISVHAQKEKDPPPPPPKPTIVDAKVAKPLISKPPDPPAIEQVITKPNQPKSKISHIQKQLPPPPSPPKKED